MGKTKLTPFWCLFILTGLNLFNYLDRFVLSAVLAPLQTDLGLNDGQLGQLNTAFMIGYFVTCPFFGYLGDRMRRKYLIAGGVFIWSLATVKTGFVTGFGMLLLARILVGIGEASYATISPSLISDTFKPAKRNNALSIFYTAIPVGAALGYVIGGQVAAAQGWRAAFFWAGAPGLLLALSLLPFKEPKRGEADGIVGDTRFDQKPSVRDIFRLFKIPEYNLVVWGYTAYSFGLGAYAHWGPLFLHRTHGMDNADASLFFGGVLLVAGLLGTYLGGLLSTAWQKRNPSGYAWVLSLSTLAAGPLTLFAFWTPDRTTAMTSLASGMFLLFLPTGPINTLILDSVPPQLRSSAMAMSIFMIHMFGDLWSPEIVGHLSDHWGDLRAAISILPAALFVGGLVWLWLALYQRRGPKAGKGLPTPIQLEVS
jgi:predicted MFS family arabinose efflux permease